jgi:Protein of unknown function (DUF433)
VRTTTAFYRYPKDRPRKHIGWLRVDHRAPKRARGGTTCGYNEPVGTRIRVATVQRYLQEGYQTDAILKAFPDLQVNWTHALLGEPWLPWSLIRLGRMAAPARVSSSGPGRSETRFSLPPRVVKTGFHVIGRGGGGTTRATWICQGITGSSSNSNAADVAQAGLNPARPTAKCETSG